MVESAKYQDAPPLVSVVIPTCNRRAVLRRCLEALAEQTHRDFEVIVVDDCSDDDTLEFLTQFADHHPELRLRVLRNESHAGANPSRNRGIREARGDLVAFEDSDCLADPGWLAALVRAFEGDRVAAVVGLVIDPPPRNIYELTLYGTHRVPGPGPANRLVGGNMCVRRALLMRFMLDEDRATVATHRDGRIDLTVSGRGDEETLFLMLRGAGYELRAAPDAVVLHEHYYTARSFFKQAFRGGRSAARLVYKHYLPPRLDMLPFMLAYMTLPLLFLNRWLGVVPAFFIVGALAAIIYNDLMRKGKTLAQTIRSFPMLLAYYHVRLAGYLWQSLTQRFGKRDISRRRVAEAVAESRPA